MVYINPLAFRKTLKMVRSFYSDSALILLPSFLRVAPFTLANKTDVTIRKDRNPHSKTHKMPLLFFWNPNYICIVDINDLFIS